LATLGIVGVALLATFAWLAWLTTVPTGAARIDHWLCGDPSARAKGDGVTVAAGPSAVDLEAEVPPGAQAARLSFKLVLEKPARPVVVVLYRTRGKGLLCGYDVSRQVLGSGANAILLDVDDAPYFGQADQWIVRIASPEGANHVTIRDARLEGAGFGARLAAMARRLTRPMHLTNSGNTFVESPMIAGHGVLFLFWIGLGLALAGLAARRWAVGPGYRWSRQALVALLAIVVVADLRNGIDFGAQASAAVGRRLGATDAIDCVCRLETRHAWFEPMLRKARAMAPGRAFLARFARKDEQDLAALKRLAYYAGPRHPCVDDARLADLAFVQGGDPAFEKAPDWRRAGTIAGDFAVYERRKP
jgi:hypothetical protein